MRIKIRRKLVRRGGDGWTMRVTDWLPRLAIDVEIKTKFGGKA